MAKTPHIDDLARTLLATAAKIDHGMLLPAPADIARHDVLVRQATGLLVDRGLADEIEVAEPGMSWRADETKLFGARINAAGREAVEVENPAPKVGEGPKPRTKKAAAKAPSGKQTQVITLMKRREGVSITEITDATGWLPHSARAALSGLRKKGYEINRTGSDAGSVCRHHQGAEMTRTLEDTLAALATMSPAQVRMEWLRTFSTPAPKLGHRLLAFPIAHRLQEKASGGLPAKHIREIDNLIGRLERGEEIKTVVAPTLRPGAQLVREWHGSTHRVMILDDAYLYRDERYGSLSEIARKITGAHWSGPRFFGLVKNVGEVA